MDICQHFFIREQSRKVIALLQKHLERIRVYSPNYKCPHGVFWFSAFPVQFSIVASRAGFRQMSLARNCPVRSAAGGVCVSLIGSLLLTLACQSRSCAMPRSAFAGNGRGRWRLFHRETWAWRELDPKLLLGDVHSSFPISGRALVRDAFNSRLSSVYVRL